MFLCLQAIFSHDLLLILFHTWHIDARLGNILDKKLAGWYLRSELVEMVSNLATLQQKETLRF